MLNEKLRSITSYPFHMPGHKRNTDLFSMDFTEISETDDLHDPKGIIKDCMDFAASVYGTGKTYFLINGSTCGILSAISACTAMGDKVLIARNCHKSVYNAIYLRDLSPIYICPPVSGLGINGSISTEDVSKAVTKHKPKIFVMTSPTYEGIVSDITEIANICHKNDCLLIVDEAHGAHFCFSDHFPKSATEQGADIVIQSLHKTLPSLTQTALLHVCSHRVDLEAIERFLSIYQTSSPSYILMASIDNCIRYMASEKGKNAIEVFYNNLIEFRKKAAPYIYETDKKDDISKIIIYGGKTTAKGLRERGIEPEMSNLFYTLALSSIGDTKEGIEKLLSALEEIAPKYASPQNTPSNIQTIPKVILSPYRASLEKSRSIPLEESCGLVSQTTAYIYPPGIPIINPGEVITPEIISIIKAYKTAGFDVIGIGSTIKVIEN